jgi:hypothetical protein
MIAENSIFETIGWIALGFVPTIAALGLIWKMGYVRGKRRSTTTTTTTTTITAKKMDRNAISAAVAPLT